MTGTSTGSIAFRTFTIDDYDALISLWREAGLPCRVAGRDRKDRIERELQHGVGRMILAENSGRLIGAVLATHDGRKGWINRLAVLPAWRRKGLGRLLVEQAETWLRGEGLGIFTCLIEEGNDASMMFFSELGYVKHKDIFYFSKRLYPDV